MKSNNSYNQLDKIEKEIRALSVDLLFLSVERDMEEIYSHENGKSVCSNTTIFYMNGNDGTDFDWFSNDRLCEFGMFRDDDYYYIKGYVNKEGTCHYIVYGDPNDFSKRTKELSVTLPKELNVSVIAKVLIDAEKGYEIGENTEDWNLSIFETSCKIRGKTPEEVIKEIEVYESLKESSAEEYIDEIVK